MKVHFIIDEAATLGHLESIDDALNMGRAYGIRLMFIFQSLGQVKKCFPEEGQDQNFLSNVTQIFFGVNDLPTAEYVSNRLGEFTQIVRSGGKSSSESFQERHGSHGGKSFSTSQNDNWAQQARKLLKPEEILTLPARIAIAFHPGVPPIMTTLVRYYEKRQQSFLKTFAASVGLLVVAVAQAAMWSFYLWRVHAAR
jgi:type IV secretion system protein VirD4